MNQEIYGLVLSGGRSTRMSTEKRLLNYHGEPQQYHLAHLLEKLCTKVFISCTESQSQDIDEHFKVIVDQKTFADSGPMGGLLSAHAAFPKVSWLIVGCDYPFIDVAALEQLIWARSEKYDAVVYQNSEIAQVEPLIGIYEVTCFPRMREEFQRGRNSVRHFLNLVRTEYLFPEKMEVLQSIDTPEQFELAKSVIGLIKN